MLLKTNPKRAYALSPYDGRVVGVLALINATSQTSLTGRARTAALAHRALAGEPLAVTAMTALALNRQIAGNVPAARQLFAHSDAVSRRELGARMWLIEDAVTRGDVVGALRHYDIALRTEKAAPNLLFPILAKAIEDQAVAAALLKTLALRPPWGGSFVAYLGGANANPVANARFLRRLAEIGVAVPASAQAGIINTLIMSGAFDDGWAYYTSVRKDAKRSRTRDPGFAGQLPFASVLDWNPVMDESGLSASIDDGMFHFAAPATAGGVVLQQMQLLPPGGYRLDGISGGIDQPVASRPYWQLVCIDGRELGRIEVPNSVDNAGRFSGIFIVGADCKAQTLRLVARSSIEIGGTTGQIKRALLTPIGPAR